MRTWAAAAAVAARAVAQDMRGACAGCGDAHRECEFDCLLPSYRSEVEDAWPRAPARMTLTQGVASSLKLAD